MVYTPPGDAAALWPHSCRHRNPRPSTSSLEISTTPLCLQLSPPSPMPKTVHPREINHFRPVGIASHLLKTLERIVLNYFRHLYLYFLHGALSEQVSGGVALDGALTGGGGGAQRRRRFPFDFRAEWRRKNTTRAGATGCYWDGAKSGDIVGDGCHSLLQQVKTRVEYKNRNNTLARCRREGRPRREMAGEARLARGPVDQYGCVRWGPADLPVGETEATLENMKRDLLNIYSEEGMSGAERAEPIMRKTYVILRKYLNKVPAPAMSEIKLEWPFLFSQKCLFSHFSLLTDIDILPKLQEAISRRGQTILDYCATLDNPRICDVLACYEPDSDKAACILLLLMSYFREPKESLMLEVDPCATAVDVNTAELPSTPCLIVQGDMMKPSGWLISIEGHVVMGPHPVFVHGVAAFFSSYYVFNLEYPAAGSSTLEFIQRCFLGINPERGSKTKKRTTMNPHVSTLLRKLIDFEWAS
ncbi:uncharacterized protein LOC121612009 [Chelmon rostratus]|uniref:uncharacterized protein LOC121612009 n=1 Tax=Chelmon rostratus TaxID=109905 RepID=UPI001BE9D039|nr:uncharacterized protein LOC121612009 [Chelmon rostratus]